MIIERERGGVIAAQVATAPPHPFLSVLTRCYRRPSFLEANVQSLRDQSDPDYEQIFIIDDIGQGLHAANRALALPAVEGAYVLVLDDDDRLADPDAVALLKEATENEPELLFFRADHDQLGILPDDKVWQRRPLHGRVGSCDFITRSDIWQRFVAHFAMPESGDFNFLHAVWESGPSVSWLDRQLAAVQRISKGAPE